MARNPCDSVLGNEMLLGEIRRRIGFSRSYIRSSVVSQFWLQTAKSKPMMDLFVQNKSPSFLGFILEFKNMGVLHTRLLSPPEDPKNESLVAMRAGFEEQSLIDIQILATSGASVLYVVPPGGNFEPGIYTTCPFSRPTAIRFAGNFIPKIPRVSGEQTSNILGQFGVLMRTSKRLDSPMAFFVKDFEGRVFPFYGGIRFAADFSVPVHVCVFKDASWTRFVSEPLVPPPYATFHRTPYCVLVGSVLYMMYLVGFIVCFDLEHTCFKVLDLPPEVPTEGLSWFDYTVAKSAAGNLALVSFDLGVLKRWVLNADAEPGVWSLDSTFDIANGFGFIIQSAMPLIDFAIDRGFLQVRCASQDCRYVFLSVGVNSALFIADMLEKTFVQVPNVASGGNIGRIFQLGENWPPVL